MVLAEIDDVERMQGCVVSAARSALACADDADAHEMLGIDALDEPTDVAGKVAKDAGSVRRALVLRYILDFGFIDELPRKIAGSSR